MINNQNIKCPSCGVSISIDDVITDQIEDKLTKEFEAKQKAKDLEISKKEAELEKQQNQIESLVKEKVSEEKEKLSKTLKLEAEKEQEEKTKFLEDQLKSKEEKLKEANKKEVELLKMQTQLKDEKEAFELEKARQLEDMKKELAEEASKKATEESKYKIAQLEKQLSDSIKAKDELARKLEQGSQQTQGEVLELELEEVLKSEFIYDDIQPVPKGVSGADIIQTVKDKLGRECGSIVWESKKTKNWSDGWISKLKEDQRSIKADIAVIVSAVLPEQTTGFKLIDGVWVTDIKFAIPLATALRINLEQLSREKSLSTGKNEKMEVIYAYLTGTEFRQRVEAIVEAFTAMEESLSKERKAFEKIWAEREKQIQKVIKNTIGMYGDLSGMATLPSIKQLELPED